MREVHVVVMAGGSGTRFWPLSTDSLPKQFLDILGIGKSLIQLTVDRFSGICPKSNIWIVTNEKYKSIVFEQLPDIPTSQILAEPVGRNTAPCIAWASWMIRQHCPNANIVVTPSDSYVVDINEFRRAINVSLDYTDQHDSVVTIGIKPTRPEQGFGYLEINNSLQLGIQQVLSFKEKPDYELANEYFMSGNYLWNAGIFVWNVDTLVAIVKKYQPKLAAIMDSIIDTSKVNEYFQYCDNISIDYAVMEHAACEGRVFAFPASFGWSDLGNWSSLYEQLRTDVNENVSVGPVALYDCTNCLIHVENEQKVIIHGLHDTIVAAKNGNILICKRMEEQRIKEFLSSSF